LQLVEVLIVLQLHTSRNYALVGGKNDLRVAVRCVGVRQTEMWTLYAGIPGDVLAGIGQDTIPLC
jgi:hypothetical protein